MFSCKRIIFSALILLLIFNHALAKKINDYLKNGRNVTRREIGYFWHVSDIFFDPTYSPLGAPEDKCRIKNSINLTRNCGFFGELGQCSAFGLVETIARAMNSTRWKIVAPEFCIFTGNLRCPNAGDQADAVYETMRAFVTDIRNAGFVNVYPSYGWYDYHPPGHHSLKLTALYEKLKNLIGEKKTGSSILGQPGQKTGYFSRVEQPGNRIRVIVMNTNFYLKNHIANRLPDPAGQWRWLIDQLEGCRMAFQKAFIVMSVPPGFRWDRNGGEKNPRDDLVWSDRHNRRYLKIISEYHGVIAAQFAGHRHQDTFRILHNREGKAVSSILLSPPISPKFGNYPTMRIYMFDKNNGELIDFVQYYFNLTKANLEADMTSPEKYWQVGYSFRDFYRLRDVTTSSLINLVQNFRKNDDLFQRYYGNIEGLQDRKYKCGARCKLLSFCVITNVDLASFFECISGELFANERRFQRFQPTPKALRDRLITRSKNNPVSSSSGVDLVLSIHVFFVIFFHIVSFLLFCK